jgi:transposase
MSFNDHESIGNSVRINWDEVNIYIRTGYTDMRKQINGLAILAQRELKLNPLSGDLFMFCGRTRRLLKILYWERNGFCLWMKRLEEDRFPWPLTEGEVRRISRREMKMLLSGIDFFHAHQEKKYEYFS